jgi:hypothetical protein
MPLEPGHGPHAPGPAAGQEEPYPKPGHPPQPPYHREAGENQYLEYRTSNGLMYHP